jgi:hypothetical protein
MVTIQPAIFQKDVPVIRVSNSKIDILISTDFGPRVLFCGLPGGPNHFFTRQSDLENYHSQKDCFHFFGGHRLWAAPEHPLLSYIPDNQPVQWRQEDSALVIDHSIVWQDYKIAKQWILQMDPRLAQVQITHKITNLGEQALHIAPWAISQMAPGGLSVMPLPPRGSHIGNLLPTGSLVLWPYSDLSDPRWRWGYEYIRVQQAPDMAKPLKFGLAADQGWLAYFNHGQLFYKQTQVFTGALYPDRGTPLQIYLDADFLELETLGPLEWVAPNQTIRHQETWRLFDHCLPPDNDRQTREVLTNIGLQDR